MATYPARTRERTVRVGREAPYQGGEAATQAPVKRPTAGSSPAPGAPVPIGQLAQAAAPSRRKPGFESLWGRRARVDQQPGRRSFTAETAGQHRPRVRARVQWRTARLLNEPAQVRILPGAHRPSRSDWNGRRATNAEIGGSNPPGGATSPSERSSTGERRPDMPETSVQLTPLAPRFHCCSRKHLARLPGRLPGEAGSIPVGSAGGRLAQR
jgi:hypothetical protein